MKLLKILIPVYQYTIDKNKYWFKAKTSSALVILETDF